MSLWMVRSGRHGEQEGLALEEGLTCIGFEVFPDLSSAKTRKGMRELVQATMPDASPAKVSNIYGQLFAFAQRIKDGDLIVLPLKTNPQIAIGRVTGPYEYRTDLGEVHHTRKVKWLQTDIPRASLGQDLLYSLGALMTVCQIQRENAEARMLAILEGKPDAGDGDDEITVPTDLEQLGRDQIRNHMERRFKGHDLARLVDAVLRAEGYVTHLSSPGPDGGVDILARRGALGLDGAKLCVQVKSSQSPADVTVLRSLQGTMSTFKADEGLLVSWGGFNSAVNKEARLSFFSVRLWGSDDLLAAIQRNYDRLPEELQNELPLKRIWALVPEQ